MTKEEEADQLQVEERKLIALISVIAVVALIAVIALIPLIADNVILYQTLRKMFLVHAQVAENSYRTKIFLTAVIGTPRFLNAHRKTHSIIIQTHRKTTCLMIIPNVILTKTTNRMAK